MAHNINRLYKFRDTYYYRAIIPKDLLLYFGGKRDVKRSLRTKNLTQARRLLRIWDYRTEAVFTTMRLAVLTDAQIKQLAEDYLHSILSEDERCRALQLLPLSDESLQVKLQLLEKSLAETREALKLFAKPHPDHDLHTLFLKEKFPELSSDDPEYASIERELIKQDLEIYRVEIERTKGNYANGYDDKPHAISASIVPQHVEAKPKFKLKDLWDSYRASKLQKGKWNERVRLRYDGLFVQLLDILGDCQLTDLEDEEKSAYLIDMLKKYPSQKEKLSAFSGKPFSPEMSKHKDFKQLSISSINQCLVLAASLMNYAKENPKKWGVTFNPFAKTKLRDPRPPSELRNVYSQAE